MEITADEQLQKIKRILHFKRWSASAKIASNKKNYSLNYRYYSERLYWLYLK